MKKASPRFKVWVEIERLKPNGDADPTWELRGKPCPDCVGTASTLKEAERIQFAIATAFGVDPENSDCRPRRRKIIKGRCPGCGYPAATCGCVPVGDEQDAPLVSKTCKRCDNDLNGKGRCKSAACPYSDHPQSWDYEKNAQ